VVSVVLINVLMSVGMGLLWGLINMIQLFEFLALVQVTLPPFIIGVIQQFTVSQFDSVPYREMIDSLFHSSEDIKSPWEGNFDPTDYNTKSFVFNMKEFVLILVMMGLFYMIAYLLSRCKWRKQLYFQQSLYNHRNALTRYGLEAYLPIMAGVFIEFNSMSF